MSNRSKGVLVAQSKLIRDTTREERIAIVTRGLDWCDESSCENCSGCSLGAPRVEAMYQPYIDGELELAEVNMLNAATKYTHG
jgi:NADH:ubiquinone oxidoreductase subunit F (NADH-binding)